MPSSYLLLLNDAVRAFIVGLADREKRRLYEKLEFLRAGLWDTGVRVKKLKASGRVVFEGRLTRGDRILFTLGRAGNDSPTPIYVWGVVKHDDVAATERRIVPADAPFLDFRAAAVEELPELSLEDLSPDYYSGAELQAYAELPTAAAGAAGAAAAQPEADIGPQRWLVVDDQQWQRILASRDQDDLLLYLHLTDEQARVLRQPPPVLLSGTAGSGKTTIAVYYLLRGGGAAITGNPAPPPGRSLFLTYNEHLRVFSERIYRGLVHATDLQHAAQPARFATFQELVREILTAAKQHELATAPVELPEFRSIFAQHPASNRFDAELVWEEIRSIIKGAKPQVSRRRLSQLAERFRNGSARAAERTELAEYLVRLGNLELASPLDRVRARYTSFASLHDLAASMRAGDAEQRPQHHLVLERLMRLLDEQQARLDQPLLTLAEYEGLGRKRAPNFAFDRGEIFRIAEYYQSRLGATGRHDEIDQCRAALSYLEHGGDQHRYQLVVCDEVQDFTDMQLSLVFRLAEDPQHTVLAGDPKQIINPSGFRWEEVRARYYERGLGVPDVVNLSVNFRSVGQLVRLANRLLELKRDLVGLVSGEAAERWVFGGKPPLVADGVGEPELLQIVGDSGAGQVVLVRSTAERDRLRHSLGTELVFTIKEAKGLEFDTVLLWRFVEGSGSAATWRRIAAQSVHDGDDRPHIRHELNLLYVAVTRARNTLVIWDGERPSPIWGLDMLAPQVLRSPGGDAVRALWRRVSTAAEWEAQGDYLLEREHYAAAEECFRNAEADGKVALAGAHLHAQRGEYEAAAHGFAAIDQHELAAQSFQRVGRYVEAASQWRAAGAEQRALRCDALQLQQAGEHAAAADLWEQLGERDNAVQCWQQCADHRRLAEHYLQHDDAERAAHHFEQDGDLAAAAVQLERAGSLPRAAELFTRAGHHMQAAAVHQQLDDADAALHSYRKAGAHREVALELERRGDLDGAIDELRRFARQDPANRAALEDAVASGNRPGGKAGRLQAAVRLAALERWGEAAAIFARHGDNERALCAYRAGGDHARAAACLAALGRHVAAAEELERGPAVEALAEVVSYLVQHLDSDPEQAQQRSAALEQQARGYLAGGAYTKALARFIAAGDVDGAAAAYGHLDRDLEAIGYLSSHDREELAHRYLDARPQLAPPLAAIEQLCGTEPAARQRFWAGPDRKLAVATRLMYCSMRNGGETDRHARLAAIVDTVPGDWARRRPIDPWLAELALALRAYAAIMSLVRAVCSSGAEPSEDQLVFAARLDRVAEDTGDPQLQLCALAVRNPARFEAALADLPPSPVNVELFAYSSDHWARAVTELVRQGRGDDAVAVCLDHDQPGRAAEVLEAAGAVGEAGRYYLQASRFTDALRCFESTGDEQGRAQAYEQLERWDEALAGWEALGRTADVDRVRERMRRPDNGDAQPGGFADGSAAAGDDGTFGWGQ